MTLVEVLAALALLGVILSALMVARIRYLRQFSEANRRLHALAAADALLAEWWKAPDDIRVPAAGNVPAGDLSWRLELVSTPPAEQIQGTRRVRLSISDPRNPQDASASQHALALVDLVLPEEKADRGDQTSGASRHE